MTPAVNEMPLDDQRVDLERRLAAHRRKIEETLSPPAPSSTALVRRDHAFPRSKLMQLLLREHVVAAAVSALAVGLMKGRAGRLLHAAFAVYKFFRKPPQRTDLLLRT